MPADLAARLEALEQRVAMLEGRTADQRAGLEAEERRRIALEMSIRPVAWKPGLTVKVGDRVTYDGVTYETVQAHTTQADWPPPAVPALFVPSE